MQASAEHVQYQLTNEHSRIGFLLEAIQCSDPGLQADMASIKTDNGLEGMRNNFEATAAHLLPYDPVAKKRSSGQKRGSAQISSDNDDDVLFHLLFIETGVVLGILFWVNWRIYHFFVLACTTKPSIVATDDGAGLWEMAGSSPLNGDTTGMNIQRGGEGEVYNNTGKFVAQEHTSSSSNFQPFISCQL